MNPELKAKELVGKYKPYMYCYVGSGMLTNSYDEGVATDFAKKCALIAVDEIIPCTWKLETYKKNGYIDVAEETTTEYWQQVKEAIEKM